MDCTPNVDTGTAVLGNCNRDSQWHFNQSLSDMMNKLARRMNIFEIIRSFISCTEIEITQYFHVINFMIRHCKLKLSTEGKVIMNGIASNFLKESSTIKDASTTLLIEITINGSQQIYDASINMMLTFNMLPYDTIRNVKLMNYNYDLHLKLI